MASATNRLETQSVAKSFFQYFIPTFLGMMLMSANIVIDGIFVGNGVGSIALASVNIAVPVFSIIISISLLIGIGGGTLYSMAMGANDKRRARQIYTLSIVSITIITLIISVIGYVNIEFLGRLFGANEETMPYVMDYMRILFLFSLIFTLETMLSIFIRNDGNPRLAMVGLIVSAVVNVFLNYWMIFILGWEVKGAAIATTIATFIGLATYAFHFFKKSSNLIFERIGWDWEAFKKINLIGFPSFLSEIGMGVFVIGYNITISIYLATAGLAAFSVINYLHTFMFLAFIGIGQTIQPLISYYYGARRDQAIKQTVKIAERTGVAFGIFFFLIGLVFANTLVAIFGVDSAEITKLATSGLKLFFTAYLFMGINFVYMTYYQSIGRAMPSIMITLFRGFILFIGALLILPKLFGDAGIWLSLPVTEAIVALFILFFVRKAVMEKIYFVGK